jgi:hypothetical protein
MFISLKYLLVSMKRRMRESLCFRVPDSTREAIEQISEKQERAIAEVARSLLIDGLRAHGIEC